MTRAFLQRPIRTFPFAFARGGTRDLTDDQFQRACLRLRACERRAMLMRVQQFHLAVLANANAGLRSLDLAAADALPGFYGFGHAVIPRFANGAAFGADIGLAVGCRTTR